MIRAIISLSCCMCAPSAYSVPSASKVTSRRPAAALAWTCAMLSTWRSSAKFGGTNSRRDRAKNSSYSLRAPFGVVFEVI